MMFGVIGALGGVLLLIVGLGFVMYWKGKQVLRRQQQQQQQTDEAPYPNATPIPAVPVAQPVPFVVSGQVIGQPVVYGPEPSAKALDPPSDLSYKDQVHPLEYLQQRSELRRQELLSNLQYKDLGLTLEELRERNGNRQQSDDEPVSHYGEYSSADSHRDDRRQFDQ